MLKKVLRRGLLVVIPLCILTVCVLLLNSSLDAKIDGGYSNSIAHGYGSPEKDGGIALLRHNAQKGDIILMGSSELGVKTDNNPVNRFPNNTVPYEVTLSGRAKVQSLESALKMGAIAGSIRDNHAMLVVSLQWFLDKQVDMQSFAANFSEVQFYETMNNKAISDETKQTICSRVRTSVYGSGFYEQANIYTAMYSKTSHLQPIFSLLSPYYALRNNFLQLQDKWNAAKLVSAHPQQADWKPQQTDWVSQQSQMTEVAEKQGKAACTNNSFHVKDDYYNEYLKPVLGKLKGYQANVDCQNSGEWADLETYFKVCEETGIKPYIVMMSTNGWFYDYAGITKEKRDAVYNRVESMAKSHGFDVLNLKDKEYEPYFYQDVMHLGWKGWLYVDEQITKHFSKTVS